MNLMIAEARMRRLKSFIASWYTREDGIAAMEAVMIFPILMTLLLAGFDLGYGILAAQKTIRASQMTADLITRHRMVNQGDIDQAIMGGQVSLTPFPTNDRYGVDVVSIEFDDEGDPVVLWRDTRNMAPNSTVTESLEGLGEPGEGLLAVTVIYQFEPTFSSFVVDEMTFQEVSFSRGRQTSVIPMEE